MSRQLLAGRFADRFIEFWDVGGNPDAAPARRMFFEDSAVAGVLLVYDVSNPRCCYYSNRLTSILIIYPVDAGLILRTSLLQYYCNRALVVQYLHRDLLRLHASPVVYIFKKTQRPCAAWLAYREKGGERELWAQAQSPLGTQQAPDRGIAKTNQRRTCVSLVCPSHPYRVPIRTCFSIPT